jgi:hypothetical protein
VLGGKRRNLMRKGAIGEDYQQSQEEVDLSWCDAL